MNGTTILIIYLILFSMEFLTSWFLSVLNLNNVLKNRDTLPEMFRDSFTGEQYSASVGYTLTHGRFSLVSGFAESVFLLIIILTGFLGDLDNWLYRFLPGGYLYNLVYILIISMIFSLISLPSSIYSQFYIEESYGFNKTTPAVWLSDLLKQILLTPVLMAPLLLGLFFFMDRTGSLWWLYASGFIALFQLTVFLLYPVLIAPLFNKFTPLEDGSLKERLAALAERTGFKTSGIFVMDGSRRSAHSNAYFTGLGKARRIVLFDTLINSLTEEELEAVLAHEIGHYKNKHITKRLIMSLCMMTAGLFVLSFLMGWEPLYGAFGFSRTGYHAILVILAFCSSPFSFFLSPLSNSWSRKHEYEADRFAREACGTSVPMEQALLKLGKDNLSNLTPHKAYSFFHYSHPALSERLAALNSPGSPEKSVSST